MTKHPDVCFHLLRGIKYVSSAWMANAIDYGTSKNAMPLQKLKNDWQMSRNLKFSTCTNLSFDFATRCRVKNIDNRKFCDYFFLRV